MKLIDNLYTVVKDNHAEMQCDISFISDSVIYKAHFPGMPVTPGVCIIEIARELFSIMRNEEYRICKVANAKFLKIIAPSEVGIISYKFSKIVENTSDSTLRVAIQVTDSENVYAKLSLILCR